jgi:antibiotic biosynthesis monooxygenase (ABM) superfamily enzyme
MENRRFVITQLIFINPGEEKTFLEFEDNVLPLLKNYGGELVYRARPDKDSFAGAYDELPYEIHILAFDSKQDFENYMASEERKAFMHLKEISVKKAVIMKGEADWV